jgi:hypothetical protein
MGPVSISLTFHFLHALFIQYLCTVLCNIKFKTCQTRPENVLDEVRIAPLADSTDKFTRIQKRQEEDNSASAKREPCSNHKQPSSPCQNCVFTLILSSSAPALARDGEEINKTRAELE